MSNFVTRALQKTRGRVLQQPQRRVTQFKKLPPLWDSGKNNQPQWSMIDYMTYVLEGFAKNPILYSAIMYKARASMQVPFVAMTDNDSGASEPLPVLAPISQILKRPNRAMSQIQLQALHTIYLNISGNSFLYLDRDRPGEVPKEIWPLRPDRVKIIPLPDNNVGYWYTPIGSALKDGIPILPQDMIHVPLPNPLDDLEGLGFGFPPMSAAAYNADIDNAVTAFLKKLFEAGLMINVYLKFDDYLDDDAVDRARERFAEIYGGNDNWYKPGVTDKGATIEQFGWTFDELGFNDIDKRNESRLTMPFGVPGILIGENTADATFSNMEEARRIFWEDTMSADIKLAAAEWNEKIKLPSTVISPDFSNVPALQANIPELVSSFSQLVNSGVPKATAANIVGLEVGDLPDGNVVYMPLSLVPIGATSTGEVVKPVAARTNEQPELLEVDAEKQLDNELLQVKKNLKQRYENFHRQFDRTARQWEQPYGNGAAKAFRNDQRELLAILNEFKSATLTRKEIPRWLVFLGLADEYFKNQSINMWQEVFNPLLSGIVTDQSGNITTTFGLSFNLQNIFARDWFNNYLLTFSREVTETTAKDIGILAEQAQAEGWSIPEFEKNLGALFSQYINGNKTTEDFEFFLERMPLHRRELIARTETMRASNAGSMEIYRDGGVTFKEWLTALDDRVRSPGSPKSPSVFDHTGAHGERVPLNMPFTATGEALMFPGDPSGSPGNTIQCRCVVIPVTQQ